MEEPQPSSAMNEPQPTNESFGNESFGRELTTDSFAHLPPEEAEEMRQEQRRLQRPLLVEREVSKLTSAETEANPLSIAFLFFMFKTQWIAEEKDANLELEDIDPVVGNDLATVNHERFKPIFEAEAKRVRELRAAGHKDASPRLIRSKRRSRSSPGPPEMWHSLPFMAACNLRCQRTG